MKTAQPAELTARAKCLRADMGKALSGRAARARARFQKYAREYEKKWRRPVAQWLAELEDRTAAGLRKIAGQTLNATSVERLIDWEDFNLWTISHFKPIMIDTLSAGGNSVFRVRKMRKQGGFDPLTQAALDWMKIHGLQLVNDLNAKSKAGMLALITEGLAAGLNPRDIAIKIRKYTGITGRMAAAAANRETWLILNRPELGPAAINKAMDAYVRKQIRYRAELISRTETAFGLNEGIREGYGQLGYERLERVEDPEGEPEWDCDCRENNGRIYTIAESEGVLPEHPGCEGSWVAAI